jgi:hypothetical protein
MEMQLWRACKGDNQAYPYFYGREVREWLYDQEKKTE